MGLRLSRIPRINSYHNIKTKSRERTFGIKQHTLLNQQDPHYLLGFLDFAAIGTGFRLLVLNRDVNFLVDGHAAVSRHAYFLEELIVQFGVDGKHEYVGYGRHCLDCVLVVGRTFG